MLVHKSDKRARYLGSYNHTRNQPKGESRILNLRSMKQLVVNRNT